MSSNSAFAADLSDAVDPTVTPLAFTGNAAPEALDANVTFTDALVSPVVGTPATTKPIDFGPQNGFLEFPTDPQPFNNLQPSLALTQVMPLTGSFPTREGPDGTSSGFQLGQLRTFGGNFSFANGSLANGAIISIAQNTALFSIFGTTYGGNGQTTFGVPDLSGTLTVGAGQGPGLSDFQLGEAFGSDTLTLLASQMPAALGGNGDPIETAQESLALRWILSVDGTFPSTSGDSLNNVDMMGMLSQWGGSFEPSGFMYADGRELLISEWNSLFTLIGTTYGGDGVTTFRIPDLRGRVPVGADSDSPVGTMTGSEAITLTTANLPVTVGGSAVPFSNLQPTLAVTYLIANQGVFPSQQGNALPDAIYLGEVIAFAGNFAPGGFLAANGQLLSIVQNQALFSLLGTTYGGDGRTTFALPNLNDRAVMAAGSNSSFSLFQLGEQSGSASTNLLAGNVFNVAPDIFNLQTTDTGTEQVYDRLDEAVDIRDFNLDARNGGAGDYAGATLAIGRQGGANVQDAFRIDGTGAPFTVVGTDASGQLQSGGQTFATYAQTGGVLTITFTSGQAVATSALVDAVASQIAYANQSDAPPASVPLAYTFRDGNGSFGNQGAGGSGVHIGATTVTVTSTNDAPALTDLTSSVTFIENTVNVTPQLLDADVTFADVDANFTGGTLTVSGLLTQDSVAVRNQGTAAGQVGVSSGNVTFGGTIVGTVTGGNTGTTLTVTFNAAATSAAVDAIIQNLTYANNSNTPTATRDLRLNVTDASGADLGASGPSTYALVNGAGNPFNGFDVGNSATPTFVDFDSDGDMDLVSGVNFNSPVQAFQNNGGVYTQLIGAANPFNAIGNGLFNSVPAFADVDSDGDQDLLVGFSSGLQYYTNNGTGTFTQQTGVANPFNGITQSNAMPTFVDLNGDGDRDLVLRQSGQSFTRYFDNVGGVFSEQIGAANPLAGNIGTDFPYNLAFTDLDGDGDLDIVVGNNNGAIQAYDNAAGVYTQLTGTANPFNAFAQGVAQNPSLDFFDYNGDGDQDAFIGRGDGTIRLYQNNVPRGQTITVNVTASNDAPGIAGGTTASTFTEGGAAVDVFNGIFVQTIEPGQTITGFTFQVTNAQNGLEEELIIDGTTIPLGAGTGTTATNGFTWTVTVASNTATVTLTSVAGVSTTVAAQIVDTLAYRNASENPVAGNRSITIRSLQDNGGTANGGIDTSAQNFGNSANVVAVNDAPAGTDDDATFDEGTTYTFLTSDFAISDLEGHAFSAVVVTTLPANGLIQRFSGGVAVETLTAGATFSAANLAAGNIRYTPNDPDANGAAFDTFTFQVVDNGGTANGGVDRDQSPNTFTFNVNPVNDAPVIAGLTGDSITFSEGDMPVLLDVDQDATITDGDSANFAGGTLTATIVDFGNEGISLVTGSGVTFTPDGPFGLNVLVNGVIIATTGPTASPVRSFTFNDNATPERVQTLVQALTYQGFGDDPATGTRTVNLVLTDGDGGTSATQTITVNATASNDAPNVFATGGTVTYVENAAAVDLFSNVGINAIEAGQTITDLTFTVSNPSLFDRLTLDGTAITLVAGASGTTTSGFAYTVTGSGSPLTVTLSNTAGVTGAAAQAIVDGATYTVIDENPTAIDRVVTLTSVTDNGGAANGGVATATTAFSTTVSVTVVNDVPVLDLNGTAAGVDSMVAYTENDGPSILAPALTLTDVDGATLTGATITVTDGFQAGPDFLTVNGGTFGTVDGVTIAYNGQTGVLTLTGTASVATYINLLNQVGFESTTDSPGTTRTINWTVTDGDGATSVPVSSIVNVTAVDDAAVARNDAAATTESGSVSGSVFADNGSGADSDVDGPDLTVSLVNGAAVVGSEITLASGARLIVNADGGYVYAPSQAFDSLTGVNGGGVSSATDSFTYTLTNGDTATVTVTIAGEDSEGDRVNPTTGPDTVSGGAGDDVVDYSAAAGSVVVDLAEGETSDDGSGNVDTLVSIEGATGSGFDDELQGSAGDNVLDGGTGGLDRIAGGEGSDTLSHASALAAVQIYLAEQVTWDGTTMDFLSSMENARGSRFDDYIYGDGSNNVLDGGRGGRDLIDGGLGSDTVSHASARDAVQVYLNQQVTWDGTTMDFLSSIENATGSAYNDLLVGDAGANVLDGGTGGRDLLIGGDGSDTVSHASARAGVQVYLDSQVTWDGTTMDFLSSIENATGSAFADYLGGDAGNNTLNGGAGNDVLAGGQGNDTLVGGSGDDVAVFTGQASDYNVTFDGDGTFRVTDTVGGRDGVDLLSGVERVRFADGTFEIGSLILGAPTLSTKDTTDAQVIPGLQDDAFLDIKGAGDPLVLPGTENVFGPDAQGLGRIGTVDLIARSDDYAVTLGSDGRIIDPYATPHRDPVFDDGIL